jgi:hypothetical protein
MNIKRIVSLTAFISFFLILLTSIIMYIAPQGRVANWSEWLLWGMSKEQWAGIHVNIGFLFLLALLFHIYYNWQPIMLYLKNKAKRIKVFTMEFNIALILTLVFVMGTYFELPPMSTILKLSEDFKASAAKKFGEPPYGHAEASTLKTFTIRMNIDLNAAMDLLKKAGYKVDNDMQTLSQLAQTNGVTPQKIYSEISSAEKKTTASSGESHGLPDTPVPGSGKLTLSEFGSQYNLDVNVVVKFLKESNMKFEEGMTMKQIGDANGMSMADIYEKIKTGVEKK